MLIGSVSTGLKKATTRKKKLGMICFVMYITCLSGSSTGKGDDILLVLLTNSVLEHF
jgi:hypothetical protein